jgi:hypothetical protein
MGGLNRELGHQSRTVGIREPGPTVTQSELTNRRGSIFFQDRRRKTAKPVRRRANIVVQKQENVSASHSGATVACAGDAWNGFGDDTSRPAIELTGCFDRRFA